jgi:hypothetical protein
VTTDKIKHQRSENEGVRLAEWEKWEGGTRLTTFSLGMLAKPEFSGLVFPPLEAMACTSSLGRLAKLPGLDWRGGED